MKKIIILYRNDEIYLNMILIAVAINVLDYPSRSDKYSLEIIQNIEEIYNI